MALEMAMARATGRGGWWRGGAMVVAAVVVCCVMGMAGAGGGARDGGGSGDAVGGSAVEGSGVWSKDNAALKYWRAFALMSESERVTLGGAVFSLTEYGLESEEGQAVVEVDAFLDGKAEVIRMLIEGSRLHGCDFSVDWDRGIEALLPELGLMRSGARLLMLDAARALERGDADAAAERVAAVLRMSEHVSQDPVLITSLVGLAMVRMAGGFALDGERAGVWSEAGRATIAGALARFPDEDPFRFVRSLHGEERWVAAWMERRIEGEWSTREGFVKDVNEFLVRLVDEEPAVDGSVPEAFRSLADAGDLREALKREVELFRVAVRMNREAWESVDALARLERAEEMLADGEFGVLARLLLPAFGRAHRQDLEAREFLGELRGAFRSR